MQNDPPVSYTFPRFVVFDLSTGTLVTSAGEQGSTLVIDQRFEFYGDDHIRLEWPAIVAKAHAYGKAEVRIKDTDGASEEPVCPARLIVINKTMAMLEWQPQLSGAALLRQDQDEGLQLHRLAALGGLAAKMAHEINNPIMVITGNVAILESSLAGTSLSEEGRNAIKKIKSVTTTVRNIIRSLQSAARDGRHDPFVAVTFRELIEGILPLCEDKFAEGGVDLQIAYEDAEFDCRKVEMIQVISNLLLNAFHAAVDTNERWVRLEFGADSREVKIRTIDSGKGIPPELREHIMRPYFTTKGVGKGTGLGLSLAGSIVQAHSGSLKLDPDHQNTCFCITFPRRR